MDQDMKRVQDAIDLLSEHFDAVQIMASRCDVGQEDGTVNVCMGAGNWFSRYGLAKAWIARQDGQELNYHAPSSDT